MREEKIGSLVGRSFEWTQAVLFKPFSLKKWLALLFIASLAGSMGGGGNGTGGNGGSKHKAQETKQTAAAGAQTDTPKAAKAEPAPSPRAMLRKGISFIKTPVGMAVAGGVLLFSFVMYVAWLWLSCRFKFIWFDAVIRNSSAISEPYRRYKPQAGSLFKASLVIGFFVSAFLAGWAVWIYGTGARLGAWKEGFHWSLSAGLHIFALPAVVLVLAILASLLFHVMIRHFVVPVMAMNKVPFLTALGQAWGIFRPRLGDLALYYLLLFALGMLAGAITLVAIFAAVIVFGLIGLVVFGLLYWIFIGLLKMWPIFAVLAVILGVPYIFFAILAVSAMSLITAVFFKSFGLNFLLSQKSPLLPASFEEYTAKNPPGERGPFPLLPIVALILLSLVLFGGIVAAIAVPNFVAARNKAIAAKHQQA